MGELLPQLNLELLEIAVLFLVGLELLLHGLQFEVQLARAHLHSFELFGNLQNVCFEHIALLFCGLPAAVVLI